MLTRLLREYPLFLAHPLATLRGLALAQKYCRESMIARSVYIRNLLTAQRARAVPGCVVECGVWRGGMIAGIAEWLGPDRQYFLFDSFAGLPPAQAIDGEVAIQWQANPDSPEHHQNCTASEIEATKTMQRAGVPHYRLVKGWFQETLPAFVPPEPIALLRLDGDWYDSTLVCLRHLTPYLASGAVIIVDDYYQWDGCAKAVHDFIVQERPTWRVSQAYGAVCVLEIRN